MNKEKIAILTDSCCDVPKQYADQYDVFVLPLKVIYKDKEFLDGVSITPQEVYESMETEIPSTSLPDGKSIIDMFASIKEKGYEKVLCITLSSGLSGTNNMINLIAQDIEGLEIIVIDTKNIAVGAGFHVLAAAHEIERGATFEQLVQFTNNALSHSSVFFVVKTLEYLQKGGRIGLLTSLVGNALNLKPIISCNDDGIYYNVAKVRGRKYSISKAMDLAIKKAEGHKKIYLCVCHGDAQEEANEVKQYLVDHIDCEVLELLEGQISPCLGVHTGPGLIGIGVYIVE